MKKKIFLPVLFFALITGFAFANPILSNITLNSGDEFTDVNVLGVNLSVDWNDCNSEAAQYVSFNCIDENGKWLDFSQSNVNLGDSVNFPDCNIFDGLKTVFAWIACGELYKPGDFNISTSKSDSITLDTTSPYSKINNDGLTQSNKIISFDLNDDFSGIDISTVVVKVNSTNSTVFDPNTFCTDPDNNLNYSCSYKESALSFDGNYKIQITEKDRAGNQREQNATVEYYDGNAPAAPSTGATCTANSNQVTITWQKNTEPDIYKYYIYRSLILPVPIEDANRVLIVMHSVKCSGSNCTVIDSNNVVNGKTYYYAISAVDKNGDESTTTPVSTGCTPQAPNLGTPTISSSTHPKDTWQSSREPDFSWTSSGTGVTYYYKLDQSSSTDVNNSNKDGSTQSTSKTDYSSIENGEHWFHVRAYKDDGWSDTAHYKIKIDSTTPSAPRNITLDVHDNGDMELRWDKPATIGPSGIKEYWIYRSESSGSLGSKVKTVNANDSDYKVDSDTYKFVDPYSGDHEGTRFYYRVKAVSNAGLESEASDQRSAVYSKTQPNITIGLPEYAKAEKVTLTIRSTEEKMQNCSLEVKAPNDTSFHRIGNLINNTYGPVEKSYTFNDSDKFGKAYFQLTCANLDGQITRYIRVDTVKPSIKWLLPKAGSDVNGTVELQAEAEDEGYGVKEVSFYYGSTKIATATKPFEGKKYKATWNTTGLSGSASLKVVARDPAGNTAEATMTVNVQSAKESAKGKAQNAIGVAEQARKAVLARENAFTTIGIPAPASLMSIKKSADINLISSKSYFAKNKFDEAKTKAVSAKAGYNKILSGFPAPKEFFSKEFGFDNNLEFITAMLSDDTLAASAKANLANANAKRKLVVYSVRDGNSEKYVIAVMVSFVNTTDKNSLQLIEVIPKEIAKSSSEIASVLSFKVLVKDPVIKFKLTGIQKGSNASVSYYLKNALSKSEVEELEASGAFDSFNNPPLVFSGEKAIESTLFQQQQTTQPAAMFSLADLLPLVGVVIVIVIAAFIAYLFLANKPVEEEETTALGAAIRRTEGKTRGFLPRFGKSKSHEKKSRWSYKGE